MVQIFADSNRTRMRYARESDSSWGTTPASGVTRELRFTSSSIEATKDTTTSDEIRADRMISDIVLVGAKSGGDMNIEFSAGSHDDLLECFSYGAWTRPMTFDQWSGVNLAWTSTSVLTWTGSDITGYLTVGRRIRTSGFQNPANNDYYQISATAFSGGNTTITVTTSASVIETGSIYGKLYDANDVIVLNNAAIRCGTAAASTFDSNGGNAFSSAISAGQLFIGQKVYIEGLGYERGTITLANNTPTAASTVTVSDGSKSVVLQFGGGAAVPGAFQIATGGTATITAASAVLVLQQQAQLGNINVSAQSSAAVISVKNNNETGGAITKAGDTATMFTLVNFSGGNSSANGYYTLTSVANDTLGVSPAPPTINNSTVRVTVKGAMLRNPNTAASIIPHSVSIETGFEDVGQYFLATGQRVSGFSYDIAANAILKGQYTFTGKAVTRATSSTLGNTGSYTALGTTSTYVENGTTNVGAILVNGVAVSTAIQTVSIKGNNNHRQQMAVSNKFPVGVGAGRIEITGGVNVYFADGSLWDLFINHTFVSLQFSHSDADSNAYYWTLPSVVFDTSTSSPSGKDTDIMENLTFQTRRDSATNCEFQIDRFSNTSVIGAL